MLKELIISDFAIVDHLHIIFSPGFNVLTGETGAGKSIIIDAVNVLLGERTDNEVIRAGANAARVEGIFELDGDAWGPVAAIIEAEALESDQPGTITLGREVRREGRHICRINGRVVTLNLYRSITEHLVDIHGQGDHLSLFRVKEHLSFLDRYGGLQEPRKRMAEIVRQLRATRRELQKLRQEERELARRVDLLQFQVKEIREARLQIGEDEELKIERNRLANAEHLITLATEAYRALSEGGNEQASAIDLIGIAVRNLISLERIDPLLSESRQVAEEIQFELEELVRRLRDYCDNVEYNPRRLAEVEERLELISNLKRKYGDSIEEIVQFGEQAERELEMIKHRTACAEELQAELARLTQEAVTQAAQLSRQRREAGDQLAAEIEKQLAELHMERAQFYVEITHAQAAEGLPAGTETWAFDETGYDQVEFLIAPNVGEPLRSLAKTASGGEAARLMLALKVALSHADPVPTLIFDEIDAGIGGRAGGVVGYKMWSLSSEHQVLCVTHLPQIAAYADTHYRVSKQIVGGRTTTRVTCLSPDERISEIAEMLGAMTESAWRNAQEMLDQVTIQKEQAPRCPSSSSSNP